MLMRAYCSHIAILDAHEGSSHIAILYAHEGILFAYCNSRSCGRDLEGTILLVCYKGCKD